MQRLDQRTGPPLAERVRMFADGPPVNSTLHNRAEAVIDWHVRLPVAMSNSATRFLASIAASVRTSGDNVRSATGESSRSRGRGAIGSGTPAQQKVATAPAPAIHPTSRTAARRDAERFLPSLRDAPTTATDLRTAISRRRP